MAARLPVMRARLLGLLACASLAGPLCACENTSDTIQIGQMMVGRFTGLGGSDDVSRSQASAIPYATLGVRVGSGGEAMLVLEAKSGDNLQWVGGTQFAIATRDGRVLRTSGFVHNLTGFRDLTPAASASGEPSGRDYQFDLADMNAYGVAVHCNEHDEGAEQIMVIGDAHQTRHLVEECSAPEIDWRFNDEFWKDTASGTVWRSVQYIHPGLSPLTLETLRPAK